MRYARIQKSPRLQRALAALQAAGAAGVTTRGWIQKANICAVSAVAAELKAQGYKITCRFEGRSPLGSSIFRYTLEEK